MLRPARPAAFDVFSRPLGADQVFGIAPDQLHRVDASAALLHHADALEPLGIHAVAHRPVQRDIVTREGCNCFPAYGDHAVGDGLCLPLLLRCRLPAGHGKQSLDGLFRGPVIRGGQGPMELPLPRVG